MSLLPTRTAASLRPGEILPAREKTYTTVDLVAYGAATWDWHRLHYDGDYARSVKLPNVIIDGQMFGAIFARALIDWLGPRAFLRRMSLKYRAMAFAGDTLCAAGEVTAVEIEDEYGLVTVTQKLTSGERIVAEAVSVARVPRED